MKKILWTLLSLSILILGVWGAGERVGFSGSWLDQWLSGQASLRSGSSVVLKGSHLIGWQKVSFDSLEAHQTASGLGFSSEKGSCRFYPNIFVSKSFDLHLSRVDLGEVIAQKTAGYLSFLGTSPQNISRIDQIDLAARVEGGRVRLRSIRGSSENFFLFAGANIQDKTLLKAKALFFISPAFVSKVPKNLQKRLITYKTKWRGVRAVYASKQLTVSGNNGPVAQLSWQ